jgi:hypothetical protein
MLPATLMKTAEQLCQVMSMEAARYSAAPFPPVVLEDAVFVDLIDPVNGLPSYEGAWRNPQGIRCGSIIFNSDGSYYAEHDVLIPHPDKPDWFVECVTVWGRDGSVKTEPRLLAAV